MSGLTTLREQDVALACSDVTIDAKNLRASLLSAWQSLGETDATLLGHAYDGVIWGRISRRDLVVASDRGLHGAKLDADTLLDLRIFGADRELRVWRRDGELAACCVEERQAGEARFAAHVDRYWILIHSPNLRPADAEFVELRGLRGQTHCPPGNPTPRYLRVRHYFEADKKTGLLRESEHRYRQLVAWKESPR